MSASRDEVRIVVEGREVRASAPSGRNRAFVRLGFGFAIPWLLIFLFGSVGAVVLAAPEQRRMALLAVLWANLLVGIIHVLALALAWLGFYARKGVELVTLDSSRFEVLRVAIGIRAPFRLRREPGDGIRVLGASEHGPGKGPHPRLEWHAGKSAIRFGAGLTESQAEELARDLRIALAREGQPL